jgi:hypothetical protein
MLKAYIILSILVSSILSFFEAFFALFLISIFFIFINDFIKTDSLFRANTHFHLLNGIELPFGGIVMIVGLLYGFILSVLLILYNTFYCLLFILGKFLQIFVKKSSKIIIAFLFTNMMLAIAYIMFSEYQSKFTWGTLKYILALLVQAILLLNYFIFMKSSFRTFKEVKSKNRRSEKN